MSQSTSLNANLAQLFGFAQFRPGQQAVVEQLLAGHSSLAIFPTGSGKSLCYQYVATQLPHLTIVVSPLLALIKDQLSFLHWPFECASTFVVLVEHVACHLSELIARTSPKLSRKW